MGYFDEGLVPKANVSSPKFTDRPDMRAQAPGPFNAQTQSKTEQLAISYQRSPRWWLLRVLMSQMIKILMKPLPDLSIHFTGPEYRKTSKCLGFFGTGDIEATFGSE